MRVIVTLDPLDGVRYTDPLREEYSVDEIDNIFQITTKEEEWINPTADGKLTWEKDSSCTSNSEEELKIFKHVA